MGIKTTISKTHYNKQAKGIFFNLLKFCSFFYAIGSGLKNKLYDKGILKPKKVDAFVISVGNLTTGGVGKTPVVAQIANYLTEKGEKVAIVSRGYGSRLTNWGFVWLPPPLRGRTIFKTSRSLRVLENRGGGHCNKCSPFTPLLEFLKLVPRFEILFSPSRGAKNDRA